MLEARRRIVRDMFMALEGTCDSATYYQKTHGIYPLTEEEQEFFDDYLRQCPECGYWYKPEDMVEGLCEDCYEEELEQFNGEEDEEYE